MEAPHTDWNRRNQALGALLSRVQLGDRSAFAALYRDVAAHLFGIILRINPDRAQAEDVLQDVFVNIWRAATGFDAARSQPLTWLASVARHRAIDSLRRSQAQPRTVSAHAAPPLRPLSEEEELLDTLPSADPGPVERAGEADTARHVAACMKGLSSEQRQSLALAFFHGLSHAEVAEHLRQPLGTVKSWMRRGLLALRDCLARRTAAAARGPA